MKRQMDLEALADAFASREPVETSIDGGTRAAVALLLYEAEADSPVELLFIERSRHPGDPWSGHLAFPGGKVEPSDVDPGAAAVRETLEEVGFSLLSTADFIGQLDDESASILPTVVSGFVYCARANPPPLALNDEIKGAFWFPLDELADPSRQTWYEHDDDGSRHAAIDLRLPHVPLLWGVTYRLAVQLLRLGGVSSPRRLR